VDPRSRHVLHRRRPGRRGRRLGGCPRRARRPGHRGPGHLAHRGHRRDGAACCSGSAAAHLAAGHLAAGRPVAACRLVWAHRTHQLAAGRPACHRAGRARPDEAEPGAPVPCRSRSGCRGCCLGAGPGAARRRANPAPGHLGESRRLVVGPAWGRNHGHRAAAGLAAPGPARTAPAAVPAGLRKALAWRPAGRRRWQGLPRARWEPRSLRRRPACPRARPRRAAGPQVAVAPVPAPATAEPGAARRVRGRGPPAPPARVMVPVPVLARGPTLRRRRPPRPPCALAPGLVRARHARPARVRASPAPAWGPAL
jgi:hypothetical protein